MRRFELPRISGFWAILFSFLIGLPLRSSAYELHSSQRVMEIRGAAEGDRLGRPLIMLDLDGDGCDDIGAGADRTEFSAGMRPTLYLFRGRKDTGQRTLIQLGQDASDALILAEKESRNLGTSLASGDINGDGIDDLVVTDSTLTALGRPLAGVAYVFFGRSDFFQRSIYDLAQGHWDLKIVAAQAGDDLGGANLFGGLISNAVTCGDFNGDGLDDIALGAHLADHGGAKNTGKVYMLFGRKTWKPGQTIDLRSEANSTILACQPENEFGTMLASGDLNGDGLDDLAAGYHFGSSGDLFQSEGQILVFLGRNPFPPKIDLKTEAPDLIVSGASKDDELGQMVVIADLNGDGFGDLIGSAGGWRNKSGALFGILGRKRLPSRIRYGPHSCDFIVEGIDVHNAIGSTLIAGDVNGDGLSDILFSTRDGERLGLGSEGRTFILFGRLTPFPRVLRLSENAADAVINGGLRDFQLGDQLAAGDWDGDGADELLLSAPFRDRDSGRILLFDPTPPTQTGEGWRHFR